MDSWLPSAGSANIRNDDGGRCWSGLIHRSFRKGTSSTTTVNRQSPVEATAALRGVLTGAIHALITWLLEHYAS